MKIVLERYSDNGESSLGLVFIDGRFECYSLENASRATKVQGRTCIPFGSYKLGLKTHGGKHDHYLKNYGDIHKGMLQILDVENFSNVLIHVGNTRKDTEGCVLVGQMVNNNKYDDGMIYASKMAYVRFYQKVADMLEENKTVELEIKRSSISQRTNFVERFFGR